MRDILVTSSKGPVGVTLAYILVTWPQLLSVYQVVGAILSSFVLVCTAGCVSFDLRHKWRRDRRERRTGKVESGD